MPGTDELPRKYIDVAKGATHRHQIVYGDLTGNLKDKIAEADLTVHELMEQIIIQDKISNLHLAQISSENITEEDIDWP